MEQARRSLIADYGWADEDIFDTSGNRPYDLEHRHRGGVVRIEVKGLSGPVGAVTLTRREVEHARTSVIPVLLVIVSEIVVSPVGAGRYQGHGGTVAVWDPWEIDEGTLQVSAYDYQPPDHDD